MGAYLTGACPCRPVMAPEEPREANRTHRYVIQNIAPKGTTVMDVASGAAPFVAALWIEILLLIFFPEIAMWLPRTMRTG